MPSHAAAATLPCPNAAPNAAIAIPNPAAIAISPLAFPVAAGASCANTAGAIKATPYGEIEAARAFGMSNFTLYRRVILPSALRRALPYYSNEVILMLHATTVAFTATVPDILKIARDVNSATYMSFHPFGIAALLYLAVSFALVWLFRRAERRWLAYLRPQGK